MRKINRGLFIFVIISIILVSISYATFNTNLYVSGTGIIRAQADVRVLRIQNSGYYGEAVENYNPNYNVDLTVLSVNLPTSASYVTYDVTIKNYENEVFIPQIELLSEVSSNVVITISDGMTTYNLPNNNMNYKLNTSEEKTYTITVSNKPGTTNNDIVVTLKYNFVIDEVTVPIIALSENKETVELVSQGTSTFGVDYYEYYISESNTAPQANTTATGNTNGILDITNTNYGHFYVWYRTVSTKGTKSQWSNKLDISRISTITFDKQGGSGGTTSVTATYNLAMPSITIPTKAGYTFGGYFTGTNGSGTQYYNANGTSTRTWDKTSATTLYAKWTVNAYTVTLKSILESNGYIVSNTFVTNFKLGEAISTIKSKLANDVIIDTNISIISTGAVIRKANESYVVVIKGDITGDGKVNSADLLKMRKYLLEEVNLTGAYKNAGIIQSNNEIKSLDLLRLRQYLLGEYTLK